MPQYFHAMLQRSKLFIRYNESLSTPGIMIFLSVIDHPGVYVNETPHITTNLLYGSLALETKAKKHQH